MTYERIRLRKERLRYEMKLAESEFNNDWRRIFPAADQLPDNIDLEPLEEYLEEKKAPAWLNEVIKGFLEGLNLI